MIRGDEKSIITQDKDTEGEAVQSCHKSHMHGRRGGAMGPEEEGAPVV